VPSENNEDHPAKMKLDHLQGIEDWISETHCRGDVVLSFLESPFDRGLMQLALVCSRGDFMLNLHISITNERQ
jgi:hypothetical protein